MTSSAADDALVMSVSVITAILSLDDDLIISRRDVQFGCRVWKV